jgi:hypothetical protein
MVRQESGAGAPREVLKSCCRATPMVLTHLKIFGNNDPASTSEAQSGKPSAVKRRQRQF